MKIVYASDENYAALTAVSAVSLLKHNPGAEIILMGAGMSENSIEAIKNKVLEKNGTFRYVDVGEKLHHLRELGANPYVSYATYARIFIADLLPQENARLLYLDCDTLVVDSLDILFEIDMRSNPLALAPDAIHPVYKKVIALDPKMPYYNAGVALIDLHQWREHNCTNRLMAELASPHGPNPLGDQDIIMRVLANEITEMDRRWNFLSQHILYARKEKPAIYHFSGNTLGRPWYTSSRHPMRDAYKKAATEAGFPEAANQTKPLPPEYKIQFFLYKILPPFLFRPVCNLMLRLHILLTYKV